MMKLCEEESILSPSRTLLEMGLDRQHQSHPPAEGTKGVDNQGGEIYQDRQRTEMRERFPPGVIDSSTGGSTMQGGSGPDGLARFAVCLLV